MAIMMITCVSAFAQVPTVMMYQVQIKHGMAAAQDVTIQMQLRNSKDGSAVWSQTFDLKDVKDGSIQNLGLEFGDKVDFDSGEEYWLATIVDGEEMGCAKLTSVPYAFVAKETEGSINAENIIGRWKCVRGDHTYSIEFRKDKSFNYVEELRSDNIYDRSSTTGTYRILANGFIYTCAPGSDTRYERCDAVARIDENHIMTTSDSGRFGKMYVYTRQ